MSQRWYTPTLIILWLASMTWLIGEKVLPPLLVGEPPHYGQIVAAAPTRVPERVAWQLWWNEQPLGSATTETLRREDQVTEIHNRVRLSRLPLEQLPTWLVQRMFDFPENGQRPPDLPLEAESLVMVNPEGQLDRFRTAVRLGDYPDPLLLRGMHRRDQLDLSLQCGTFTYHTTTAMLGKSLVGDGISPRARLTQLHVGQRWTEPVYSPFHTPHAPLQILEATVEREEPLSWHGEIERTWLVVYRLDSGLQNQSDRAERGRAWVRHDGIVLREETTLLGAKLAFVRWPDGQGPSFDPLQLVDPAEVWPSKSPDSETAPPDGSATTPGNGAGPSSGSDSAPSTPGESQARSKPSIPDSGRPPFTSTPAP